MKLRLGKFLLPLATAAMLALPTQLSAQEQSGPKHHHYKLIDLGTFGGPSNIVAIEPTSTIINNAGVVVGAADTSVPSPQVDCYNPVGNPDCFISHAYMWTDGILKDLGTLPGGSFSQANAINQWGQISGLSETDSFDPATGNPEFHAVFWNNGKLRDLGTLGGTASASGNLNDFGQVTGISLNAVPDPFSLLALGSGLTLTQTRGFFWQNGKIQDLGDLGGPDTWAVFVNDLGQVAGASYTSYEVDPNTGTPPVGVFLWQNGRMKDIGNLGGDNGLLGATQIVNGFNNRGDITGWMVLAGNQTAHAFLGNGEKLLDLGTLGGTFSFGRGVNDFGEATGLATLPGDQVNHGFLWRNGTMIDLGTLGGDPCSDAISVNDNGQVVGASQSTAGGCNEWTTAFLWENGGSSVDLNSLVTSTSGAHLNVGLWTNARGEIVAGGVLPGCEIAAENCGHTFLLVPCDENHPHIEDCDYSLVETRATAKVPHADVAPAMAPSPIKPSFAELMDHCRSLLKRGNRGPLK